MIRSLDPDYAEGDGPPVIFVSPPVVRKRRGSLSVASAVKRIFADSDLSDNLRRSMPQGKHGSYWVKWAKEAVKELT